MRFLLITVKNIHSSAKLEFLKKRGGQQWYPYQLYGSPLNMMYTLKFGKSRNTNTDLQPIYSMDFRSRYVSANTNMQSSKIMVNIPQKLIC